MNKPKLYLIAGANASFKSTYAPVLVDDHSNTIHIDFDEEKHTFLKTHDIDLLVNQKLKELESFAFKSSKDIAFQSNLLDPNDVLIYAEKAKQNGYDFNAIFMSTSNINQNIAYNTLRGQQGFHCVSNYTIELSYRNCIEGIKDNIALFDNLQVYDVSNNRFKNVSSIGNNFLSEIKPNKLIVEPVKVLEVLSGKVVYKHAHTPLYAVELLNELGLKRPQNNFKPKIT